MTPKNTLTITLWAVGIALGCAGGIAGLAVTAAASQARINTLSAETNARQDERIRALEAQVDLLRADLTEIKRDVKTVLQEVRR